MKRTTVMLPVDLKMRAQRRAEKAGVSLGEFIRDAMERALRQYPVEESDDPMFTDAAIFEGAAPGDLSRRHDDYLYGEEP